MRPLRLSIPTIPLHPTVPITDSIGSLPEAISVLTDFLKQGKGKTIVLTGAGMSVDSGIRAYRGEHGFQEFVSSPLYQKRYWSRSYLGYPPVKQASPNPGHYALEAIRRLGLTKGLITQNVDHLHHLASPSYPSPPSPAILELHGSLRRVTCLSCSEEFDRDTIQDLLGELNPHWREAMERLLEGGKVEVNPDGDVDLVSRCTSPTLKPSVIFFGESLPSSSSSLSRDLLSSSSQLLILGSTLATYSAYRLVRQAKDEGKPVGLVNVGFTRADGVEGRERDWDWKAEVGLSEVLTGAAKRLLEDVEVSESERLEELLRMGKVKGIQSWLGGKAS